MAKKPMTNDEVLDQIADPNALPDFANFEEENLAFPPYWEPEEGKWFYGMVVACDDRDPEFVRYVIQAEKPVDCMKGSKDEQEPVKVQKDEFFTLSAYGGLPLDRYIGIRVLVQVKGRKDVGKPQKMWEFTLKVSPEDKKQLMEDRKAVAAQAMRRFRDSRKNTNALPAKGETVPSFPGA